MKRTQLYAILMPLVMLCLTPACRMNNGDIGSKFGTWALTTMVVDGQIPDDFVSGQTLWSFQNNIIDVQRDVGYNEPLSRYGSWEDRNGHLYLNFTHSDSSTEPGQGRYEAPTWIGFTTNEIIDLTYIENKPRHMMLTWVNPEGKVYCYILDKTY